MKWAAGLGMLTGEQAWNFASESAGGAFLEKEVLRGKGSGTDFYVSPTGRQYSPEEMWARCTPWTENRGSVRGSVLKIAW